MLPWGLGDVRGGGAREFGSCDRASDRRPEADSRRRVGQLAELAVRVMPGAGFGARSRW
jgi:hypothetical protein